MRDLTDLQWIILWEIDDAPERVWRRDDGNQNDWFIGEANVTQQVTRLLVRGLIEYTVQPNLSLLAITPDGQKALERRDYFQVIDRFNSRQQ